MTKTNAPNERLKKRYLTYVKEALGKSENTVDQAAAAIDAFQASTKHRDFGKFRIEQAKRFKDDLERQTSAASGKPLSKSTINARLMAVKAMFQWLAGLPGFRSKISYSDCEYFNLSANDSRIAHAAQPRDYPSIDQVYHVLRSMPVETVFQRRDRAVIAATLLTCTRVSALASLSLKHFDLEKRKVFQDARDVKTKNAKTFTTFFFPIDADVVAMVLAWFTELREQHLFGPTDPAFPPTLVSVGASGLFEPSGLSRTHWANANGIRTIFKNAFEAAGLPYFHPHSFRHTLGQLSLVMCHNLEQITAWGQSYGHEHLATLLGSYAKVPMDRQAAIFDEFRSRPRVAEMAAIEPDAETIKRVVDHLTKKAS